ncbi:MAG: M48 family metallopeptidase [Lentisphaerae bacterium]|nr:M48 family metallopeptidase [Lentisphaerota bacterium]
MDFFAHQDVARRKTTLLIGYYTIAVVLIVLGVYLAFAATFAGAMARQTGRVEATRFWNPDLFVWVTGGTLIVVALGTIYKVSQLASGGAAVARLLGGRPVNANASDPDERKILNVVEEMAIASGAPVPGVYILEDERGINAFAAGFSPADAVVAVTRGCVQRLTRDELQGVVAHEFSHIFNGDMRLNVRLMGVLHGILVIAMAGYWIMRSTMHTRRSGSRDKGGSAPIALLGLALMIIGYVGVFFAKLIKSAVSRQREFLADASAVQFTRNPLGIAGALKKIAGFAGGSRIRSPNAEEASHFFFCNGLSSSLLGLMATHPPIEERIRRLDSSFQPGGQAAASASAGGGSAAALAGIEAGRGLAEPPPLPEGAARLAADPDEIVARVGAPGPRHLAYARQVLERIPAAAADAAREPFGARAIVYGLLLSRDGAVRASQWARLEGGADAAVLAEMRRLAPVMAGIEDALRLPLLDLAVPALRDLSPAQYQAFMSNVDHLVRADEEVDLFEYALRLVLRRQLEPAFGGARRHVIQYYDVTPLLRPAADLLTALAAWGADDVTGARRAFAAGASRLGARQAPEIGDIAGAGLGSVDAALGRLAEAGPAVKRRVVAACAASVGADGKVTVEEAELLRAVSDALDCPLPPFTADMAA